MNLLTPFTQIAQVAPVPEAPNPLMGLLPFILIFAAMWFLIIAPQRKKQKEQQKMIEELKSGDDVITVGGIFGTITNVKNDRFIVKVADNVKIEVLKSSVQSRATDTTNAPTK